MIDFMKIPASEAERLAYAEGFTGTAALFARIDALETAAQNLLGSLDVLGGDLDEGIYRAMDNMREALK